MKKIFILIFSITMLYSCKSENKTDSGNIVQIDSISCSDYSRPFKQAFKNLINNQDPKIFILSDSTFIVTLLDDNNCSKTRYHYSSKRLKTPGQAVMLTSTHYQPISECGGQASTTNVSAEIVQEDIKTTLLKMVDELPLTLSIETDRPCSLTIASDKNNLTMVLTIDHKEAERINFDFTGITHFAEIAHRFKREAYSSRLTKFTLNETEENSHIKDCVNRTGTECVDTDKTVRDYIDLN